MSRLSNHMMEIEEMLGDLLEDMTNEMALEEIEKKMGTFARGSAELILDNWEREHA